MDSSSQQQESRGSTPQPINPGQIYGLLPMHANIIPLSFDANFRAPIVAPGTALISSGIVKSEKEEEVPNEEGTKKKRPKVEKKSKEKRRASDERVYKCNRCNKSYLSYPALYTHTKLKHVYTKDNSSITNGRMRGRPKKPIVYLLSTLRMLMEQVKLIQPIPFILENPAERVDQQ